METNAVCYAYLRQSPNIAQVGLEITVKPSLDRNKMFEQIRD
jgi:hypothetical protein